MSSCMSPWEFSVTEEVVAGGLLYSSCLGGSCGTSVPSEEELLSHVSQLRIPTSCGHELSLGLRVVLTEDRTSYVALLDATVTSGLNAGGLPASSGETMEKEARRWWVTRGSSSASSSTKRSVFRFDRRGGVAPSSV